MINLAGQQFGRLTVQAFVGRKGAHYLWECLCTCGNIKEVQYSNLMSGNTLSCGCLRREKTSEKFTTHGQSKKGLKTATYYCWCDMLKRCHNPKNRQYKNYGGRGIEVCKRWHTFENFFEDMGDCPDGMTLDRKNNDGDYTPENCRWATYTEQNNNRRDNIWYKYKGERKTVAQWARSIGINDGTLRARVNELGWSIERALTPEGNA